MDISQQKNRTKQEVIDILQDMADRVCAVEPKYRETCVYQQAVNYLKEQNTRFSQSILNLLSS